MSKRTPFFRLMAAWREWRDATEGNVTILFAFALIPLFALTGAAIDYSRATAIRTSLQAAADSAALAVSLDAAKLTKTEYEAKAKAHFYASFNRPELPTPPTVTADYDNTSGSMLTVTAKAVMPTDFMGVINIHTMDLGVTSITRWGTTRLRVALALDTTGSMDQDNKMVELKKATHKLLDQLKAAAVNPEDVYVSIVPFSKDVNVGTGNTGASWIDWSDWDDENGTCSKSSYSSSRSTCENKNGTWTPDRTGWNGCITDRGTSSGPSQDYDRLVTAPGSSAASKFLPEQYDACSKPIMGLSNKWTDLNALVDKLSPNGATNQPIGLVWAWQTLVGIGPFTVPAKDSKYNYNEVVILMSDGLNTLNRWNGNGRDVSTAVDKRMYEVKSGVGVGTCANVKAANIAVYTIHVNTDRDPESQLLKNCASTSDKFWMITSANELTNVFTKIGDSLSQLRIAQ